ncbi:hypothetical protein Q7F20_01055 [Curtobacterium sp. A7_M15]|uniref:hypothetical protein n=1 Tax=Curtobacterium sp. A7_M15 TaxID=3065241 RepID=UPI002737FDF1|nr:hypothetical protein [Curtobacterium sp. A7_M15]MDP4331952.1 hypothetical protein [Curtobacterium sp. A7_M15]
MKFALPNVTPVIAMLTNATATRYRDPVGSTVDRLAGRIAGVTTPTTSTEAADLRDRVAGIDLDGVPLGTERCRIGMSRLRLTRGSNHDAARPWQCVQHESARCGSCSRYRA